MDEPIEQVADVIPAEVAPALAEKVALLRVPGGVPNLDEPLEKIVEQHPDLAVRVRFGLTIYDPIAQEYRAWDKVAFSLECREHALASQFRADLEAFVRGWVEAKK